MVTMRLSTLSRSARAVDHDRVGLARRTAGRIVSCTALTSNTPGRAGMITIVALRIASSTTAEIWRRVDEHPFDAVALGGSDDAADGIHRGLDRRLVGAAQFVPERKRALRIGIDQQNGLRCLVNMGSEMSCQGTLSQPPLRDANTITFIPWPPS